MLVVIITMTLSMAVYIGTCILVSPRQITRRGMNAWVGIRTPALLASSESWERGHRIAWPWIVAGTVCGVLCAVTGVAMSFAGFSKDSAMGVGLGIGTALWGILHVVAAVQAERGVR
ncbi:SdpI/YhfL protein family protein [Austwickia chelonae]|uniref:SdpI/YhfL family protein n=1 Tax=Austwickia chelonae NBRC 105200 TaxID=1184607 RepID=K6V5K2_9MICO|nr:hypothetical protein AUCHE_05_03950 [Austwickia chelonae NBRC 105200]SEW11304.1 SdpI/YhfL protein family protein [Austwickia chelonae]